ncbi:hypothetical protein [Cellulosimicrobium sp. Marseille-Q4280]|uniref:hypothetical protein n=1 Tax=Cellulosimicrobium sp. Marseille-Q4280 TaxID=2937992 RepID=UPI00203F5714|nr:hypothetical protein [Cellulosimicrobium sp. Marseille-Q4280]
MSGLTTSARRSFDAHASAQYVELSRERARLRDAPGALAAQIVSDMHKVMSGLWSKASGTNDPAGSFFSMATQVMRPALTLDGSDLSAHDTVEVLREGWSVSMRALAIPLFFPPINHLDQLGVVTPAQVREAAIGDETLDGFLATARAKVASTSGPERASWAIRAHLVVMADQVADLSLMSALARWQLIEQQAHSFGGDPCAAAREVLGPVEWVRLSATLDGFGLHQSA